MHTSNTFVSNEIATAWHKFSIIPEQDFLYFMGTFRWLGIYGIHCTDGSRVSAAPYPAMHQLKSKGKLEWY